MSDDEGDSRRDTDSDPDPDREPDALDDPVSELDDSAAEIDDPFAELGAGVGERDAGGGESESDAGAAEPQSDVGVAESESDVGSEGPAVGGPESSPPDHASDPERGDPFDELGFPAAGRADASDAAAGRGGSGGPSDSDDEMEALDDAFEQMDVDGPAEEDVWESLDADAADEFGAAGPGGATSVPGGRDTEHVVSKRTYCQQCPHFTSPPEAGCTHEGTTIVEAVGFDEFRVRNCPMVSEENPTFDTDR